MQILKRFRGPRVRTRTTPPRNTDLRWGVAGLGAVIVLTVAIGVVYFAGTTPQQVYRADLTQAGSIRPGDDVRIAGIPVGKVKSLTLQPDHVRMEFTVEADAFLGDQTVLGIRMLTVVGGYYVAVQPSGSSPLGKSVIPAARVLLPYNLTQAFQDAVQPVRQIDGDVLRQNLAVLSTSVAKSPESIRAVVQSASDLVTMMNKQNADISRTLAFSDEYLTALRRNSDVLATLLINLGTLENLIQNNKVQVAQALDDLAVVLQDFIPLGRAWDRGLKDRAQPLADAIPQLQQLGSRLGELLDALRGLGQRLLPLLPSGGGITLDQSNMTLPAPAVCVPVPGGGC
ncbi:MlaD family protein [Nocardia sp. NPDC059091]|uniref:MlaD family protein n=1 Tax=unclassified Nocardia TaxID=2637762 RepID=UPI0036CF9599